MLTRIWRGVTEGLFGRRAVFVVADDAARRPRPSSLRTRRNSGAGSSRSRKGRVVRIRFASTTPGSVSAP